MPETQYIRNHQIDPATGFMENPAYVTDFDASRKVAFLDLYKSNGLKLWKTCRELGLSCDTIHKHYRQDSHFKQTMDNAQSEYFDELEGVSRINALNPKMVIERIFQLKSRFPEKYGDAKQSNTPQIVINIDGNVLEMSKKREILVEAKIVEDQQKRVLALESVNNNIEANKKST